MKKIIILIVLTALITLPQLAQAKKMSISLGSVTGNNTSQSDLDIYKSLIKNAIANHKKGIFVEEGGKYEMSGEINRLKQMYIVILSLNKDEKTIRSQSTKIYSFDEIDVAAKRLVAALIEDKDLIDTAERGVVLEKEQEEITRLKSIGGWEFGMGIGIPFTKALKSQKSMFAFGGGYMWDVGRFLIELRSDLLFGYNQATMNAMSFTVGGHYIPFTTRTMAVYTGLDAGFAHANDSLTNGKSGFGIAGNAGILFLRQYDINLDVRLRTMVITTKLNGKIPVIGTLLVGIRY